MKGKIETYLVVGQLKKEIIDLLNINLPPDNILMAPGVKKHVKKKHKECLKYISNISDIILNPDYVGVNPNEPDSVELVKFFDDNILVSINLSTDTDEKYLFVSSIYDISDGKLNNRINSGRLKKFN